MGAREIQVDMLYRMVQGATRNKRSTAGQHEGFRDTVRMMLFHLCKREAVLESGREQPAASATYMYRRSHQPNLHVFFKVLFRFNTSSPTTLDTSSIAFRITSPNYHLPVDPRFLSARLLYCHTILRSLVALSLSRTDLAHLH